MTAQFDLSELNGANGFHVIGVGDVGGVSTAGDINGDGLADILISTDSEYAPFRVHVIFGSNAGFDETFDVGLLDGSNGFIVDSAEANVAAAGDINGDGFDDFLAGVLTAIGHDDFDYGGGRASYVVFGAGAAFPAALNAVTDLDGSNGFVLMGTGMGPGFDNRGPGTGIRDINNDGLDDFAVSNPGGNFIVFGSKSGFGASFDLSTLNGANGFVVDGVQTFRFKEGSAARLSAIGDINGDGIDDFIVGDPDADPAGRSNAGQTYVIFGSSAGFAASFNVSTLNGSNGFVLNGVGAGDMSGASVSGGGDVNGDGIDDLIIGAPRADPNGADSGEVYVVFGSSSGFGASLELSALDGSNGFTLNGINADDRSGFSVAAAGDVDGDGLDDFLIGSYSAAYLIFGSTSFPAELDLSSLNGSDGVALDGDLSFLVSAAGEVNGDGFNDVLIGANVVFGGPPVTLKDSLLSMKSGHVSLLSAMGAAAAGDTIAVSFRYNAGPETISVNIDDLTFDLPDFADGAVFNMTADISTLTLSGAGDAAINAGASDNIISGNSGNNAIAGDDGADTLDGGDGNDSLFGGFGDDRLDGGAGNDFVRPGPGKDTADGGAGVDTINLSNTGVGADIDLTAGAAVFTGFVESILNFENLVATTGDDTISGTTGANVISSLGGDDALLGLRGNDSLFGGFGDDWLDGGKGNDFMRSGPGKDTLRGGDGDDVLGGGNKADLLSGGGGNDLMLGSNGNDRLFGGPGDDTMLGGNGRDTLSGGAGADRLNGGAGADILAGSGGADTLTGGAGDDRFWYRTGAGADRVTDFMPGSGSDDVIRLFGFGAAFDSFAEVQAAASQVGADTVIDFGGGNSITLEGVTLGDLHADDFLFG